jgi:hypothetical protein
VIAVVAVVWGLSLTAGVSDLSVYSRILVAREILSLTL